jgi:hypothetical protein
MLWLALVVAWFVSSVLVSVGLSRGAAVETNGFTGARPTSEGDPAA